MKFNNGKGCACPLEEALNCAVSEKKKLAKNMPSTHSFMYRVTNIYLMSTMKKDLPYKLDKHEKT